MAEARLDLTKGGTAVVMIGNHGFVQEYKNDPRVRFIDCKEVQGPMLESTVPDNTKLMVITDGLPQWHSTWAFAYAKRKDILYLIRKSNQAVYETLNMAFRNNNGDAPAKPSPEQVKEEVKRGKLQPLIEFIDYSKSNAENAKNLMRIATERNILTTEASLNQLVSNERRKQGRSDIPRSVRPKIDVMVEMFDTMIREMNDFRDFVIETAEENKKLRRRLEKFQKAFEED